MKTIIIAAMTQNRVIGKDNSLPWNLPQDLQNFKKLTSGNTIVMGRKTFDSIGRALPNRNNIVISRSSLSIEGVDVCNSVASAIDKARSYGKDIFIIGGATIYEQILPLADKMILSFVKEDYQGDTFFPKFNKEDWIVENKEDFEKFEVVTYEKY